LKLNEIGLLLYSVYADITCLPISTLLENTLFVENQGSAFGAMVTYTCKYGFQFVIEGDSNLDPTATIRKTVRCDEYGEWGPNFADCKRTKAQCTRWPHKK